MSAAFAGLPGLISRPIKLTFGLLHFLCLPTSDDAPNGWGKPYKDENGEPINPPLGTPGGSNPEIALRWDGSSGSWRVIRSANISSGLKACWLNDNKGAPITWNVGDGALYRSGSKLSDAPGPVLAAAINTIIQEGDKEEHYIYVLSGSLSNINSVTLYRTKLIREIKDWETLHEITLDFSYKEYISNWAINSSCTKAACVVSYARWGSSTDYSYSWANYSVWPLHHLLELDLQSGILTTTPDEEQQQKVIEGTGGREIFSSEHDEFGEWFIIRTNPKHDEQGNLIGYTYDWERNHQTRSTVYTQDNAVQYNGVMTVGVGYAGDTRVLSTIEYEGRLGGRSYSEVTHGLFAQFGWSDDSSSPPTDPTHAFWYGPGHREDVIGPYVEFFVSPPSRRKATLEIGGQNRITLYDTTGISDGSGGTTYYYSGYGERTPSPFSTPAGGPMQTAIIPFLDSGQGQAVVLTEQMMVGPNFAGSPGDVTATIQIYDLEQLVVQNSIIFHRSGSSWTTRHHSAFRPSYVNGNIATYESRGKIPRSIFGSFSIKPANAPANEDVILSANYLSGADPVQVTQIIGTNPRFHPVRVI